MKLKRKWMNTDLFIFFCAVCICFISPEGFSFFMLGYATVLFGWGLDILIKKEKQGGLK